MSASANLALRRHAYKWAAVLDFEVAGKGDIHGIAVWCSLKYIGRFGDKNNAKEGPGGHGHCGAEG